MENNFELEEMKQQWSTLQTALNSQKEVNVKLILKDAKRRISWNKSLLRIASATLIGVMPIYIILLPRVGVPQPIYLTLILLMVAIALNALYLSFIIRIPNDSNIDIVKYSRSLVKFKKYYLRTEVVSSIVFIAFIIWAIISMGFDITNPHVMGVTIGGVIGGIIGVLLALKMLANVKELQNDIDLIEKLDK